MVNWHHTAQVGICCSPAQIKGLATWAEDRAGQGTGVENGLAAGGTLCCSFPRVFGIIFIHCRDTENTTEKMLVVGK